MPATHVHLTHGELIVPPQPLVIAHHLIWTAYGWWPVNDPRGSSSRTIRCDIFKELGELHHGRKRVQPARDESCAFLGAAQSRMQYDTPTFDAAARRIIADAFGQAVAAQRYTCYGCAIMPDHVHVVMRKHRDTAEQMIASPQGASRQRLRDAANDWAPTHPVWGGPGWKVFLDHPDEIRRTIGYVADNPLPLGWPRQAWSFVTAYDGWPLHPGHSPNSPYAKRLQAVGRYP